MKSPIVTVPQPLPTGLAESIQEDALTSLEHGQVLFFPELTFDSKLLTSENLWTDSLLDSTHKNVSYHHATQRLGKLNEANFSTKTADIIKPIMHQYAAFAMGLVQQICPSYQKDITIGRTSFRPAKIDQRKSSKRTDDTRLHVDAFSASPVYGKRILRVFTNINPDNIPRVWHIGEPFENLLDQFAPNIPRYHFLIALILKSIKTTKTIRSPYDHYQIYLHDRMKRNDKYQETVEKQRVEFPANSTWMVFTDQVSHAALSGQFLLEQTFYLPVSAMQQPELSPLKQWEQLKGKKLA